MEIGKLRHRVIIQQNIQVQDSEGVMTENWVNLATVWASIELLQGRELLAAQAIAAEVSTRSRRHL